MVIHFTQIISWCGRKLIHENYTFSLTDMLMLCGNPIQFHIV